jgi:hypothetical protein
MHITKPSTWFRPTTSDATPKTPPDQYPRRAHAVDAIAGARAARCPLTQPVPASTWMREPTPIHDATRAAIDTITGAIQLPKAV